MYKQLLLTCALLGFSPALYAAAPGHAPLPKDEHGVENDMDEDDGSITPTPSTPPPLSEEIPEAPTDIRPKDDSAPPPATPPSVKNNNMPENYRPSGESGEKIFDWSKHKDETEVKHPFAEKGLIRIGKDNSYYYKVDESPQTRAASLHVGTYNPTDLKNPDTNSANGQFSNNYEQNSNPAVLLEYEWQGWRSALGKFGIRAGTGVFVAQGHGHFVHDYNTGTPLEQFTFVALPNTIGAVYRMQLVHRQLFVPYAEGGGIVFTFGEFRDDNKAPKWGGALGAYAAGGVAINLTYFDYITRVQLDREYGINACYLTLEYRQVFQLSRYNFASNYVNGGVLMEF